MKTFSKISMTIQTFDGFRWIKVLLILIIHINHSFDVENIFFFFIFLVNIFMFVEHVQYKEQDNEYYILTWVTYFDISF